MRTKEATRHLSALPDGFSTGEAMAALGCPDNDHVRFHLRAAGFVGEVRQVPPTGRWGNGRTTYWRRGP